MTTYTSKVKLVAQQKDSLDYTTYVFEIINSDEIEMLGYKYIMCTRWPNWDHRELVNGEIGYLNYSIIIAGQDTWYNGSTNVYYKYSNYQFNKFVSEQKQVFNKNIFE